MCVGHTITNDFFTGGTSHRTVPKPEGTRTPNLHQISRPSQERHDAHHVRTSEARAPNISRSSEMSSGNTYATSTYQQEQNIKSGPHTPSKALFTKCTPGVASDISIEATRKDESAPSPSERSKMTGRVALYSWLSKRRSAICNLE